MSTHHEHRESADTVAADEVVRAWLLEDPDPDTRAELEALLAAHDTQAIADRFGSKLEFGTAGLRGALGAGPNRMNRVVVIRAAAGLATYVRSRNGRSVVIGYDARHKSDVFARDTAEVMAGAGLDAYVLPRPLPTPLLAFAIRHLGVDAGVMVTASHNPPQDNGYKVYLGDGSQIVPPADAEISAEIDAVGPLASVPRADGWTTLGDEVLDAYLTRVSGLLDPGSGEHPGGLLGELVGPVPGVAADDHPSLRRFRAAVGGEPFGERRRGCPDHGPVHPVGAGPDRAAQARGAELQPRAKPVGKIRRRGLAAIVEQRAQFGAVPLVGVARDPALGLRAQFGADHGSSAPITARRLAQRRQ